MQAHVEVWLEAPREAILCHFRVDFAGRDCVRAGGTRPVCASERACLDAEK